MHVQLLFLSCVRFYMSKENEDTLRLLKAVGKTYKMMTMTITDQMKQCGIDLTREQGMLLKRLHQQNGMIQNDLAWITFRDKSSLARLVDKMEKKGLIQRRSDIADKRVKRVYLTAEGKRLFKRVDKVLHNLLERLNQGIDPNEMKNLITTLEAVQNNLDNQFEI